MRRLFKHRPLRWLVYVLLAPYALALVYIIVPPPSTLMLYDLVTFTMPKRTWVPLEEISPNLAKAVLVAEDSAFCDHFGFDFRAIEKSLDKAADGKRFGGASTITQQTAKNLFLWHDRSWLRKVLEAPLALWLELVMSKQRILEIYLNIAEWAPGVYGAEAAAKHHFGTTARNLSLAQSALLAASLPNPERRVAGRPSAGVALKAASITRRALMQSPDTSCLR
ncbi:MAG: monofunctional biosynthetic peptidoglycan transglycosylase [Rickettsiales bacterium]|jgi:monofunctional biosynthetic peptidoglycan transglycosylase|nr:monofunctional biosynthetic peptidoglycan transglycosylase [Rickettsiales bacterium]